MNLKGLFCNHIYNKSISRKSERKGSDNYVFDIEFYKCEKCNHSYVVKVLVEIEHNYYAKYSKGVRCSNCVFFEDTPNREPCKSCISNIKHIE